MKHFLKLVFVITLAATIPVFAQDKSNDKSEDYSKQTDLKDLLRKLFKKKKDTVKIDNPERVAISILPGVSYNPATDIVVGVSASASWYMGDPKTTSNSSISSGVSYTTKNQFKLSLQTSIFSKNDKWSQQGDLRFWKYVQYTYGLGTGTQKSNAQNMKFKLIRINENLLRNVSKGLYVGLGYSLEYFFDISTIDSSDNILYPNENNTYSKLHGIDSSKYLSSGLVLNAFYDSRDNTINAYKGVLLDIKYYNYNEVLGSTTNWQKFDVEFRTYKSLNKKNSYRLALWLMGTYVLNGRVPYMSLAANGWDKYNATARGYIQGRFRGRDMLYGEIENRINLTKNGLFGLAIFANAITMSNPDANVKLMDYIEPAAGVGLRIKFEKYSRTNISVDYARGRNSSGVFLTIGEFF